MRGPVEGRLITMAADGGKVGGIQVGGGSGGGLGVHGRVTGVTADISEVNEAETQR